MFIFVYCVPYCLFGQKVEKDSILIDKNTYVFFKDSVFYAKKDTTIYYPRKEKDHTDFYNKLKERLSKNKLTQKLYNAVFRSINKNVSEEAVIKESPYVAYEGKTIRNIKLKKINAFGEHINDTTKKAKSWFQKTANKLHINTQNHVIYNSLLFKKGDQLDPFKLSDSERLLRSLPFIMDSRLILDPIEENSDSVDIVILTQDRWSISADFTPMGLEGAALSLSEKNVAGMGHQTSHRFIYDTRLEKPFGYEGLYQVPFIGNTFINSEINFARTYFRDALTFNVSRPFVTPETEYAGGIFAGRERLLSHQFLLIADTISSDVFDYEFNRQDVWLGRSFPLKQDKISRSRFIVSARMLRSRFIDRPKVAYNLNRYFHNRTLFLGSIGFSRRAYERNKLIYAFGVTEDIPYGRLMEFTAGYEKAEFYNRFYGGLQFAKGVTNKAGYVYGQISIGGFLRDKTFEQGIIRAETNFFSNLFWVNNFKLRQFIRLHYTNGIRRLQNELIDINNLNGIRGFISDPLRGAQRVAINLETVVFSPLDILDFKFAFFAFADVGRLGTDWSKFLDGISYQGYGIGLRLRNENLAFQTFQIRFAYYPVLSPGVTNFGFDAGGIPMLLLQDYDVRSPRLLDFN